MPTQATPSAKVCSGLLMVSCRLSVN
uniref:Uncharacterized protein n=1 Tax=Rhizophora mucronata TaxID=61149 RepID=A0A2P2N3U0_RHIMU